MHCSSVWSIGVSLIRSETVVVIGDENLDLIEVLKVLEDAVLKHCVELVLNRRQKGVLFVDIEAKIIERCFPIELVKVQELEGVNDLTDAGLHLGFAKE